MTFQWPLALLLLLAVPLVLGLYQWKMRRRRKQAVRYSSVALLRSVVPKRSRWKRHAPVALLLSSLGVLAVASSRPQMVRDISTARTSVILALDVSRSMCSTDIQPNRLGAAQAAAREFVKGQPKGTRMGLVAFSGFAQLVVAPTSDREALTKAIDGLATGRGTAIGAAMLKSLDAIAEINDNVAPVGNVSGGTTGTGGTGRNGAAGGAATTVPTTAAPNAPKAGAQGYVSDIVVLLTDGANTSGIQPLDAAPYAVERRVRVFTIGFGTSTPAQLSCSASQLGGDAVGGGGFGGGGGFPGGGGFGGGGSPLVANEAVLQQVAAQTGAQYYKAQDAAQLRKVFADLPKDVTTQKEKHEMSSWFAALGALLAGGAIVASIKWSPYP